MGNSVRQQVNIFWFRRDLRLPDNAGLYHALKAGLPVIPLFIFDSNILDRLEDRDDARVTFIHRSLETLVADLEKHGASLYVKHSDVLTAWTELASELNIHTVFTNSDYEPYATLRDQQVAQLLQQQGTRFSSFKDQVIFEKEEIVKEDGKPYTVFSAYQRKWLAALDPGFHFKAYPVERYTENFSRQRFSWFPSLQELGFTESKLQFPDKQYLDVIAGYHATRDFPAIDGTSRISIHLRFGTLSIRKVATDAWQAKEKTWLSELIWREFYAMILWHFPESVTQSFKKDFDHIRWRNNETEFKAWCEGMTGYPLVDAGMRQLNATGWMHNRVRMVTASFLSKHLLIDWRWGEAYFARRLNDYDQASNVGGWQWAASSGNDAVPYFRVFNPQLQQERFDPDLTYIRHWIPEFDDPFKYPQPVVDHKKARERVLSAFKQALATARQ